MRLPREQEVIINDTVGFIRDLPPDLLSAFRSTLEEISGSRLLLHVVDAANPRWQQQIASVDRILAELEFDKIPRLLVFNKIDIVDQATVDAMLRQSSTQYASGPIAISALDQNTLNLLLRKIGEQLGPSVRRYEAPQIVTSTVQ